MSSRFQAFTPTTYGLCLLFLLASPGFGLSFSQDTYSACKAILSGPLGAGSKPTLPETSAPPEVLATLKAFASADKNAILHATSNLIAKDRLKLLLPACQEPVLWAFSQSAQEMKWPIPPGYLPSYDKLRSWVPPARPIILEGLEAQASAMGWTTSPVTSMPQFHENLGEAFKNHLKPAADKLYQKALDTSLNPWQRFQALNFRAKSRSLQNQKKPALLDLDAALALQASASLLREAALIALELGDYSLMQHYRSRMLKLHPQMPDIELPVPSVRPLPSAPKSIPSSTPSTAPIEGLEKVIALKEKLTRLSEKNLTPQTTPPVTDLPSKVQNLGMEDLIQALKTQDFLLLTQISDQPDSILWNPENSEDIQKLMMAPIYASEVESRIRLWLHAIPLLNEPLLEELKVRMLVWLTLMGSRPANLNPWEARQLQNLAQGSWLEEVLKREP